MVRFIAVLLTSILLTEPAANAGLLAPNSALQCISSIFGRKSSVVSNTKKAILNDQAFQEAEKTPWESKNRFFIWRAGFDQDPNFALRLNQAASDAVKDLHSNQLKNATDVLNQLALARNEITSNKKFGLWRTDPKLSLVTGVTETRYALGYEKRIRESILKVRLEDHHTFGSVQTNAWLGLRKIPLTRFNLKAGKIQLLHTDSAYTKVIMNRVESLFTEAMNQKLPLPKTIDRVAEIHWWLTQLCPFHRGSASITDAFTKTIFDYRGIETSIWKKELMPDFESFVRPREDFIAHYQEFFVEPPRLKTDLH